MEPVPQLNPAEARKLLTDDAGAGLLDVRETWEYETVHLEGACHIPMDELQNRLAELNPERVWLVLCHHGNRSRQVANWLRTQGYQVRNVAGGIDAWAELDPALARY